MAENDQTATAKAAGPQLSITVGSLVLVVILVILGVNYFSLKRSETTIKLKLSTLSDEMRYVKMISSSKEKVLPQMKAETAEYDKGFRNCSAQNDRLDLDILKCSQDYSELEKAREQQTYQRGLADCLNQLATLEARPKQVEDEKKRMIDEKSSWPSQDAQLMSVHKMMLVPAEAECKKEEKEFLLKMQNCTAAPKTAKSPESHLVAKL